MATQGDRSLSSGMSLPRWMKTKISDRFDLDQSTFSPTEIDDSFMYYYRHAKSSKEVLKTNNSSSIVNETVSASQSIANSKPDFSKHTPFCQKYLQNGNDSTKAQQIKCSTAIKLKPSGTDDGFKGEAAKCGSSVVRVAHQMVAGKMVPGISGASNSKCDSVPEGFNPSIRRGSKSLPSSPLTSPKSSPKTKRRVNKYFTGAFVDTDKHHGSWILSGLLSKRQTLSQSVEVIAEEDGKIEEKKSASNASINDFQEIKKKSQSFIAKPSEYREMNFWSPTSM